MNGTGLDPTRTGSAALGLSVPVQGFGRGRRRRRAEEWRRGVHCNKRVVVVMSTRLELQTNKPLMKRECLCPRLGLEDLQQTQWWARQKESGTLSLLVLGTYSTTPRAPSHSDTQQ